MMESAPGPAAPDETMLAELQRDTFDYFAKYGNPRNGLIADNTRPGAPASIAIVGFTLAAYPVGVERGYLGREEAAARTLAALRFFRTSAQGPSPGGTGYRGFYYHFLDMRTGRRVWQCELSTVDSAFLLAGALAAAGYFQRETSAEAEIRRLADDLYRRADWHWALNKGATLTHGWTPENGFLKYRWEGYDEALLLYVLGLGSPTHPIPPDSFMAWCATYRWRTLYDLEFLYGGPLFIHQFSHMWLDLRGIQDKAMRDRGLDYFENSRLATFAHQRYAIHNPREFAGYNEHCWGLTASDGPGWVTRVINGRIRSFFDYFARGIPDGPDDGTLASWAVVASLPFAPELVLPTIRYCRDTYPQTVTPEGFKASYNPTFAELDMEGGFWVCRWHYGLNQGPIVLMIENFRSGLLWRLMRRCPYVIAGLRRAGFDGGWLEGGLEPTAGETGGGERS